MLQTITRNQNHKTVTPAILVVIERYHPAIMMVTTKIVRHFITYQIDDKGM